MGLFDIFKRKNKRTPHTKSTAVNKRTVSAILKFYNDCVKDYHNTSKKKGLAKRGVIFIPELIPIGEKIVLSYLKDSFFQAEFRDNPQMYYYVIMSLSIEAGIVSGAKWHEDFSALMTGYVDRIIVEGPSDECKPYLKQLGLASNKKENAFCHVIFDRWLAKHKPYWRKRDPREYTFRATLAAYQLGVSMILEKLGY